MKVLVVDDDNIALAIARKVLESDHHEVLTAPNGLEALEVLRRENPRMVLSDWNMPGIDGIELCRRVRAETSAEYTYVVLITSRKSKEDMLEGLAAGADDFISKPFEPAELTLRVRNAERMLGAETTAVTIFALAKLAESKDTDTGLHLERMRAYSRVLAEWAVQDPERGQELSPRYPELIFQTSPLHDIGKVGIPDSVLLKPARLSDGEWVIMKRHAEIGADTLSAALQKYPGAEFLRIARDIAWAHHERWDGGGYPRGLMGEEIPLAARLVALADVYDALTMKRVYKSAMPHDVARGIILEGRGTHFDPRIVQAFLDNESRFLAIRDSLSDSVEPAP